MRARGYPSGDKPLGPPPKGRGAAVEHNHFPEIGWDSRGDRSTSKDLKFFIQCKCGWRSGEFWTTYQIWDGFGRHIGITDHPLCEPDEDPPTTNPQENTK